jgi:hypothetical protein
MTDIIDPQHADSGRLKQVNLELGRLAKEHHACRVNSFGFSAFGAVVLAISALGLIHMLPAGGSDWTRNPNSPVYSVAVKHQHTSMPEAVLVASGFVMGLVLLYRARTKCSRQRRLWKQEGDLRKEMRRLRDKLYVSDRPLAAQHPHPHRHAGHTAPLDPDAARGEYVGIYNPAGSHRELG